MDQFSGITSKWSYDIAEANTNKEVHLAGTMQSDRIPVENLASIEMQPL
jgi:hypothetical protein